MKSDRNHHIISLIPRGRSHAVSMEYLSAITGIPKRTVRQAVMLERINGAIIVGDANGYYLPETQSELRAYYKTVMTRQKSTAMSIAAARRKLKQDSDNAGYEQMSLFDVGADYGTDKTDTLQ